MDCFVENNGPQSQMGRKQIEAPVSALPEHMADAPEMELSGCTASASSHHGDSSTERIAQAVAALLTPTVAASVEKAVNAGMRQIKKVLGEHETRLNEAEHRPPI